MLEATRSIRHCHAEDCNSLHPVSTGYAQGVNFRHKKTTLRWFRCNAYALIFILFVMVPGAGLEPAQRERRGILNPLCLPIPPSGRRQIKWRRVPESNRTRRICNPLHNRFVNAPNRMTLPYRHSHKIWSGKRDSNSRPQPWQGCALPTELFPHNQLI